MKETEEPRDKDEDIVQLDRLMNFMLDPLSEGGSMTYFGLS